MESKDVFISYRFADKEKADKVVEFLEEQGYSCWIAPRNEIGGENFPEQIVNAIINYKVFLLIASENINGSRHIKSEVSIAFNNNKPIIAFEFGTFEYEGNYTYFLTLVHRIQAIRGEDIEFTTLLEAVRHAIEKQENGTSDAFPLPQYYDNDGSYLQSERTQAGRLITDWGDAPPHMEIFGRQNELDWLVDNQKVGAQIFCLVGYGGIGKSTLARNWADYISDNSDAIVWVSFKNRPDLNVAFKKIHQLLEPSKTIPLKQINIQIDDIVNLMKEKRAVVILDNLESVMKDGDLTGSLLDEFLPLERFIKRFADTASKSVVLLTTREMPTVIAELATSMPKVCKYKKLDGLDIDAVSALVGTLNLTYLSEENLRVFKEHHGGSPYAISLTAPTIIGEYGGVIDKYVENDCPLPSRLMKLLDTQISRLSDLQKIILYRIAVERIPVSIKSIQIALSHRYFDTEIIDAIEQLRQRSLLEPPSEKGLYYIQNVLSDYATDQICKEMTNSIVKIIRTKNIDDVDVILRDLPILTAMASGEIRDAQLRTLVTPIYKTVSLRCGGNKLKNSIYSTIRTLGNDAYNLGYATGTLINIMLQQSNELNGLDLSDLCLWSCDFEHTDLIDTSFRGSDLQFSRFREVLSSVSSICFGINSHCIYFGTSDGTVHFQDIENQIHIAKKVHLGYVRSIAFNASNNTIITVGEDKTAHILNAKTMTECANAIAENESLRFVSVSKDGKKMIWGGEKGLLVKVDSNGARRDYLLSEELIRDGCFFEDNSIAFVTESGTILCGDFDDDIANMNAVSLPGEPLWCITEEKDFLLVTGKQGIIHRFTKQLKEVNLKFEEAKSPIWHIVSGENYYVAATSGGSLLFYDKNDGRILYRVAAHENWIRALAVDESGQYIASGSADQSVRVYTESSRELIFDLAGETINFLAITYTGKWVIAGGTDGILHCWSDDKVRRIHRFDNCWIRSLAYSKKLNLVAIGYSNGQIELWDPDADQFLIIGIHPGGDVWSLDFHPDSELLASAGEDGQILEWSKDFVGNWKRRTVFDFGRWAIAVRYSPDGKAIACGDGLGRVVISANDCITELPLSEDSDQAWGLAWGKDDEILVAERSAKIRIWHNIFAANPERVVFDTNGANWGAAASNNITLVAGDSGYISLINENKIDKIKIAQGRIQAVAAGQGDDYVIAGYDGVVLRISSEGKQIRQYLPDKQYSRLDVNDASNITELQLTSIKQFGGNI